MSIKTLIEQDIKQAMLAGDKTLVTTLRGLKSAIMYAEVAKGLREDGLPESEIIELLSKEAKKRQESAQMYLQGGSQERADAEITEKTVIEKYLPKQLDNQELIEIIDSVITQTGSKGMQDMGKVIGAVKSQTSGSADGARIAQLVKERLSA